MSSTLRKIHGMLHQERQRLHQSTSSPRLDLHWQIRPPWIPLRSKPMMSLRIPNPPMNASSKKTSEHPKRTTRWKRNRQKMTILKRTKSKSKTNRSRCRRSIKHPSNSRRSKSWRSRCRRTPLICFWQPRSNTSCSRGGRETQDRFHSWSPPTRST